MEKIELRLTDLDIENFRKMLRRGEKPVINFAPGPHRIDLWYVGDSLSPSKSKVPQHDFPEVGSYIEIVFAMHKPVKATVVRHSALVIQLSNGMTVPFHAVHWWRSAEEEEKKKVTLELFEVAKDISPYPGEELEVE